MTKTKRMKAGDQLVTRKQLHVLLSQWARSADLAFSVKLAEMEDRLRAEWYEQPLTDEEVDAVIAALNTAEPFTSPTVPTDSEGAE